MSNRIKCPKCRTLTEADSFCEHCGASLEGVQTTQQEDPDRASSPEAGASTYEAGKEAEQETDPDRPDKATSRSVSEAEEKIDEKVSAGDKENLQPEKEVKSSNEPSFSKNYDFAETGDEDSECGDLTLELDESVILVKNMRSTFKVQLKIGDSKLENVSLKVYPVDDLSPDASQTYHFPGRKSRLKAGMVKTAHIPFTPDFFGQNAFRIRVDYARNGQKFSFESDETQHMVYKEDDTPTQVINQVKTHVENKGHAADVPVENTLSYYEDLQNSKSLNINSVLQEADKAPAAWIPLPLYNAEDVYHPPAVPPEEEAFTDKLSLMTPSLRVHLIAGEIVTMGRKRREGEQNQASNDIILRAFDKNGQATRELNQKLSKYHCHIRRDVNGCYLRDEGCTPDGVTKKNIWGTYLDGKSPKDHGPVQFPAGRKFHLCFCDPEPENAPLAMEGYTYNCDLQSQNICPFTESGCGENTPAAVTLQRTDAVPEIYVLLWGYLNLGNVTEELKDLHIWRCREAFAYNLGENQKGWLVADSELSLPGDRKVKIEKFNQWRIKQ